MVLRKFIPAFILLCLFSFAAGRTQGRQAATGAPTEIYFYQRGYVEGGTGPATTLTDAALKAFEARHPEIRVHVTGVPWEREGDLKLRTALLAGRRIDCFRLAHIQLPGFLPRQGNLLAPVDPKLTPADRADFSSATLAAVSDRGRVMAWPLWSTALMLVANTQILEARGIHPPADRPWTWEEFTQALQQATYVTPAGQRVTGLNAPALPPVFEWAPLLMAHCGPLFPRGTALNPDGTIPLAPELGPALASVRELGRLGVLAPGFGADDQPAAWDGFLAGRSAFLMTSPGFLKTLVEKRFPFTILPPPTGRWGRPITSGALGCIAVVDSHDPARIAAAHTLCRYLTSAEVAADVPGWYLAPPARASVHSYYDQPAYRPLQKILPTAEYLPTPVSSGFFEGTIIPSLQMALLGQLSPEAAIARIQAAARRVALQ